MSAVHWSVSLYGGLDWSALYTTYVQSSRKNAVLSVATGEKGQTMGDKNILIVTFVLWLVT